VAGISGEPVNESRQLFNKAWIYLAVFLIILALIAKIDAWLVLSAFLLTILPIAWWWNRHSLDKIVYERELGERRAFPGEVVDLTLRITNQKLMPLGWLTVEDQWAMALPLEDGILYPSATGQVGLFRNAFSIRWFERVSRNYKVRCTCRGYYPFGPVRLRSGDIFGLFQQGQSLDHLDWLIVYPQVLPLAALGFPAKEPLGEIKADWRIFEDPVRPVGVRDHQPEDSFRDVHWKATARRQQLQTKVFEPTTSHNLMVFLNVTTFEKHWHGVDPKLLERAIGVAASVASHAVEQRFIVGLIANGSIPHSDQPIKVPPSRRPDQLTRVLEALAAVTSFATSSIDALLLTESRRLQWGSTLVVVTPIITRDLQVSLLRLRDVGRRLVLVTLEEKEPPASLAMHGILVHHLPASSLPFDDTLLGEPDVWTPEFAPPLTLGGESP
jgi:uncharacterized protein (DUF58 family)